MEMRNPDAKRTANQNHWLNIIGSFNNNMNTHFIKLVNTFKVSKSMKHAQGWDLTLTIENNLQMLIQFKPNIID